MKSQAIHIASIMGGLLILINGCAASQERDRELRQQLDQTRTEQKLLKVALENERAKVVILKQRLGSEQENAALVAAELELTQNRARQLEEDNQRLISMLETAEEATRAPTISASPLPESVDQRLQSFAKRRQTRVWYDRGHGGVALLNEGLFDSGSDHVRSSAEELLSELAGISAMLPESDWEIVLVGHTDATPIYGVETLANHPSNWHLSVHRAIAVKNVLVAAGIPDSRMGVMGYAANRSLGGDKARDRRVEVYFVRKGDIKAMPAIQPAGTEIQ